MATIEVTVCDECGRQKLEANHWMVIGGTPTTPHLFRSCDDWEAMNHADREDFRLDYCSQKCLISVLGRWMDTGSIEKSTMAIESAKVADS